MTARFLTAFVVTAAVVLAIAGAWDVWDRWRNRRWEKKR